MLEARNVTIQRGRATLLRGVNAVAKPGELLIIAGMNGAGKTTLLRALSGELTPVEGEIFWNGKPLASYSSRELARVRGYLEQRTICTLPFRAVEIVRLGAEASRSAGDADALAVRSMQECGVGHLMERLIDTLSGGEQQRVHWARVVAQLGGTGEASLEGKCLLLDEPISALDLAHQHEMMRLARGLVDKGCAVIAVLHDLNLSAEYGDRLLLLGEGGVVAEGPPSEVVTPEMIRRGFGVQVRVEPNPATGTPCVFVEREPCL